MGRTVSGTRRCLGGRTASGTILLKNSFEKGGLYPKPDFWKIVGRTGLRRYFEKEFEKGNGLYPKTRFWKIVGRTELRRYFENDFEKGNGLNPKTRIWKDSFRRTELRRYFENDFVGWIESEPYFEKFYGRKRTSSLFWKR